LPPVSGGRDEEMEMEDQEVYAEDEGMGDEEDVEMM
jgi:intron-binding protein aquarius